MPELLQDDVTPEAISAYINDLFALDLPPTQRVTDESSTPLVTQSNITRLPVHSKGSCLFAIDQARLEYIMLRFTQLHLTLQQNADEQSADVVTRYLRQ